MPDPNGMDSAVGTSTATSLPAMSPWGGLEQFLTDLQYSLAMQGELDFVEAVCNADTGNAISVPAMFQSGINIMSGGGILLGVVTVFGVGILAYGLSKMSSTASGGGGKGYVVGGLILFGGGVMAYTIPNIFAQAYDGGGACFSGSGGGAAMITPPEFADAAVMTVIALL